MTMSDQFPFLIEFFFFLFAVAFIVLLIILSIKYSQTRFMRRYGAPDYKTALKIQEGGFPNYALYSEARRRGADTLIQFNVTERFQVKDYALAFNIVQGQFPNYDTYRVAFQEGYTFFPDWSQKEKSKAELINIMKKAEALHRDDFMTIMGFPDSRRFMEWFMSLPEDNPFVLKADSVSFRMKSEKSLEEIVNAILCYQTNPQLWNDLIVSDEIVSSESRLLHLSGLPENQRHLINDLREGKALPLSELRKVFQVREIEIASTLQPYLPKGKFLTRIADLYRLIVPSPNCQVCHQFTSDIPHFQCKTCGKYLCQGHYSDITELGYPVCPSCNGDLLVLPLICGGCQIYYFNVAYINNFEKCQFCNYQLTSPDISHLKTSSLSSEQLEEISKSRKNSQIDNSDK